MSPQRRNLLILAALIGVWGLILVFRMPWGAPARPPADGTRPAPARTPPAQGGGLPRLKTELLHLPPAPYPSEVQSIFGTPPPPPPPPRPVEVATAPASLAPPPPDPFQEEAKRLRYVGFLQAGETATAFIVQGTEVHTVAVGATFLGRFRVQAVTEDSVLLSSPEGDKQARLPLAAEAGPIPRRGGP